LSKKIYRNNETRENSLTNIRTTVLWLLIFIQNCMLMI